MCAVTAVTTEACSKLAGDTRHDFRKFAYATRFHSHDVNFVVTTVSRALITVDSVIQRLRFCEMCLNIESVDFLVFIKRRMNSTKGNLGSVCVFA